LKRCDQPLSNVAFNVNLRHYNLVDAKIEETIDAHPGATVCGLDYHPKKEVMVTSSTDGTAKFWVPSGGRAFE